MDPDPEHCYLHFLQNGAERDARDLLLMTPLHWAVERGCVGAMEILLKYGACPDLTSKFGKSPLDIASDNGRPDLYEILLVSSRGSVIKFVCFPAGLWIRIRIRICINSSCWIRIRTQEGKNDPLK